MEEVTIPLISCKQCPHLIREASSKEGIFHATCAIHKLGISGDRPRYIKCNIDDSAEFIAIPTWCEKSSRFKKDPIYESYESKKEKWNAVPSHLEWDDFEVNKCYRVPRILDQNGQTIRIKTKNDYNMTYSLIKEDGSETGYTYYLYKRDIKLKYIIPLKSY